MEAESWVEEQLEQGRTRRDIRADLRDAGWAENDIDRIMDRVSAPTSQGPTPTPSDASTSLLGNRTVLYAVLFLASIAVISYLAVSFLGGASDGVDAGSGPDGLEATIVTPEQGETIRSNEYEIVHRLENTGDVDTRVTATRNLTDSDGDFDQVDFLATRQLPAGSEINWTLEVNTETREANLTEFCDASGTCSYPSDRHTGWGFSDNVDLIGAFSAQVVHENSGEAITTSVVSYEVQP